MASATSFDKIADQYDDLWTRSAVGQLQRRAVWNRIDKLFRPQDRVLDLGCGTGEDAVHLRERGVRVEGIDGSEDMVRVAQSRGVDAHHVRMEDLHTVSGIFDGAISNFGALNCVEDLPGLAFDLARLIRVGGYFAGCWMGRFCGWETAWYVAHGDTVKSRRRWSYRSWSASFKMSVFYPSRKQIEDAFKKHFRLVGWHGIGIAVPPSYVSGMSPSTLAFLGAVDRTFSGINAFAGLADHRLAIFVRTT